VRDQLGRVPTTPDPRAEARSERPSRQAVRERAKQGPMPGVERLVNLAIELAAAEQQHRQPDRRKRG